MAKVGITLDEIRKSEKLSWSTKKLDTADIRAFAQLLPECAELMTLECAPEAACAILCNPTTGHLILI